MNDIKSLLIGNELVTIFQENIPLWVEILTLGKPLT
jgi:hypothetical protein